METVHIWRGPMETDPYGNGVQGPLVPIGTVTALVAPVGSDEPRDIGRQAVVTGHTLYITGPAPSGIRATDLLEVRSPVPDTAPVAQRRDHLSPVDGDPAVWRRRDGSLRGEQVTVKTPRG